MTYYLRNLLPPDKLERLQSVLSSDSIIWADGRKTITGLRTDHWDEYSSHKRNVEAVEPIDLLDDLRQDIYSALDADREFFFQVVPHSTPRPMFTRTDAGGNYCPHHDAHDNGHYSTTLFLSDPNTYEGGELTMMVGGKYLDIKPEAGWAITYPTGTPHCVKPVTSGSRLVSVFWTKSSYPDPEYRDWYGDIMRIMSLLPKHDYSQKRTLEEAMNDPRHILDGLSAKMNRKFLKDGRYSD